MNPARPLAASFGAPREKLFGAGRPRPLDYATKRRIMARARALMTKTAKYKHYGAITAKDYRVLEALLWIFHNGKTGLCFPSYERIAAASGACRSQVAISLRRLEAAKLLTWVHRLKRVWERCADLFGADGSRKRVMRTSNGYQFFEPPLGEVVVFSTKSKNKSGTPIQDSILHKNRTSLPPTKPDSPLQLAIARLEQVIKGPNGDRA